TANTQGPASPDAAVGAGSGACSNTMWANTPPYPYPDTPAIRGLSAGHGTVFRATRRLAASQGIAGFGVSHCKAAGINPCRRVSAALITPTTPAAPSRWPMFDFTEPISSGA